MITDDVSHLIDSDAETTDTTHNPTSTKHSPVKTVRLNVPGASGKRLHKYRRNVGLKLDRGVGDDDENSDDDDDDDDKKIFHGKKLGLKPPKKTSEPGNETNDDKSLSVTQALTTSQEIIKTLLALLFANTTSCDKLVLILGSVFAFVNGFVLPFTAIIFGSMTNSFIQQSLVGFANSTSTTNSSSSPSHPTAGLHNFTKGILNSTGTDIDEPASLPDSKSVGISEKVGSFLDVINKVVLQTFAEHEVLTKDEFIDQVHTIGKLFLWLAIIVFLASYFEVLCWEWIAANQKIELQGSVVKTILRQNMTWFQSHDIGEIVANVFSEVGGVKEALGIKFGSVVQNCAMFLSTSLIAVFISWRLALVFLVPAPFVILKTLMLGKKIAASSTDGDELWNEAEALSSTILDNVDTVTAFGQQENVINEFGTTLEDAIDLFFKKFHLSAVGKGLLTFFIYATYAGAFWYGCRLLMQGSISAGELFTIFLAITMGTVAITNIMSQVTIIGTAYGSAKHLSKFGKPYPEIDCFCTSGKIKESIEGDIEFKLVTFGYPERKKILDKLSFKIEAGQTVAIVGDVGAGKTAIANLLLRIYDADRGKIRIDGISIKKFNLSNLRSHIGIAMQQPHMNEVAIDANIKAGRSYVTADDIQRAKEVVDPINALNIENYCDAYDLPVDTRQKINLARSIVHEPDVLILDENFSDLQSFEKESTFKSILDYRKGKTTIILTTDVLSVEHVDKIYVLKNGQILPSNIGTHKELLEREDGNVYKLMHQNALNIQQLKDKMLQPKGRARMVLGDRFADGFAVHQIVKPTGLLGLYDINSTTKNMFCVGVLGCILVGAQSAIFAFYFVQIFATFSKTGDQLADDGIYWAGMLLALALIAGVGFWLRPVFMSCSGLYIILSIRATAFASILRRPKSCFIDKKDNSPSALGTKVMCNGPFIKHALEFNLPELLSTIVTLLCISILVCLLLWQIGLIVLVVLCPLLFVLAFLQFKYVANGRLKIIETEDKISQLISKAFEMIHIVQAYNMQEYYLNQYFEEIKPAIKEDYKQAKISSFLYAICGALFFLFFGASFLFGSYLISNDLIQPESLFKVFFAMSFCIAAFIQLVSLMPDLAKGVSSLKTINNIVLEEYDFDETLDAVNGNGEPCLSLEGTIEFRHANFSYPPKNRIFKNLNLLIPSNSTTSIVGKPSFGGTTLCYFILRFYDVDSGELLFDHERNIKQLNLTHLRQQIGWVPQDIKLFAGSISANIGFGSPTEVSEKKIKEVLATVRLLQLFEHKLDNPKDEKYWNGLSRGIKVLLAIARAIIRDPKILLLDSPTASMSGEEEMQVLDVIKEIKSKRTCIIITNCPCAATLGDKVAFIEDGRVVEEGTHQELLALNGYYASWVQLAE